MSLISRVECTPNRVASVTRYLLTWDPPRDRRERLEAVLSPMRLRTQRKDSSTMIGDVVGGCIEAGLLVEEEDYLVLHPDIAGAFRKRTFDPVQFRDLLIDLLLKTAQHEHQELEENPQSKKRDALEVCLPLAWMLAQDVTQFQGDPAGFEWELRAQTGDGRLGLTNPDRVRQFRFWVPYLGFGWMHRHSTGDEDNLNYLVPDPTAYIARQLPILIETTGTDLPIGEFLQRLAKKCPLFPGGVFYEDLASSGQVPDIPVDTVLSSVALALLRLHDRRILELTVRNDGEGLLLPDGTVTRRCTHLKRVKVQK